MTRRRWVYETDPETGEVVSFEVGQDWTPTPKKECTATEELVYGGMRATDGTPINTRTKHRRYMKERGLTTVDDYTQAFQQAEKLRERIRSGDVDKDKRRDQIGRAMYLSEQRERRERNRR